MTKIMALFFCGIMLPIGEKRSRNAEGRRTWLNVPGVVKRDYS